MVINSVSCFPLNFTDPATGNTLLVIVKKVIYQKLSSIWFAMLGWSPADNKEIVSMDEMIKEFDLNKVHKSRSKIQCRKNKMVQSAIFATDV